MRTVIEIIFWASVALIAWTQVGYFLALWLLRAVVSALRREQPAGAAVQKPLPSVSLIVAAHNEERVISAKVKNATSLAYPRDRLEVIVACDGCSDRTAATATAAGADVVLELPRGGKIRAQDAAARRARGEILAFSDANALWEQDALIELVGAFADAKVGYACGAVSFERTLDMSSGGTRGPDPDRATTGALSGGGSANQEGAYWRYELALRGLESELSSITAGNGAIYATRKDTYITVSPVMGHDLSLPFNMVKRGLKAVFVKDAKAREQMVPSIEGEQARKRRMMAHTWAIVLTSGMLLPHGYSPLYALMIFSHRLCRYLTPFFHLIALCASAAAVALGASPLYTVAFLVQLALLAAGVLGRSVPIKPLLLVRYYLLTSSALAIGLWDWLRHGVDASWEAAEGTR